MEITEDDEEFTITIKCPTKEEFDLARTQLKLLRE